MPPRRIGSLDGLRGVAAFAVLMYHIVLISPVYESLYHGRSPANPIVWLFAYTPLRVVWAGREAVWVFFVLSGFVLIRPYLAGRRLEPVRYYARRGLRLYLPFFGSFLFAVTLRAYPRRPVPGQSWAVASQARHVDVIGAAKTLVLVLGNKVDLDNVWWSLQWEIWFSILLPVVVIGVHRARRSGVGLVVTGILVSAIGPELLRPFHAMPSMALDAVRYLPMFAVGVGLAMIEPRVRELGERSSSVTRGLVSVGALSALVATTPLLAAARGLGFPAPGARILAGVAGVSGAALLVALALGVPPVARALSHRPIRWLGERSFTLYLVHVPVVITLAFAFELTAVVWWVIPVFLAASLLTTAVLYELIERPVLWLLRRIPATADRSDRTSEPAAVSAKGA